MKIALISPRGGFFSNDGKFGREWFELSKRRMHRNFWSGLNTGLLEIAALTPKNFKIKLIDENFDAINFKEDFNLVGIGIMTQQTTRGYQIADIFREKGVKVVMGGIHATVLPEEAKEHADSVVIGEAEELWPKVIEDFLNNEVKPFYKTDRLADMTKSPIPRYDLMNLKNYKTIWIQATRGCPIDCEFCAASKIYGFKFRHKQVDQVIDEIKYIIKLYGQQILISFADDNMFVDKRYSAELMERLIDLKIRWLSQTDISIVEEDEKFLKLLKKAGCAYLFIGFETLSKKGFKFMDKGNWKFRHFVNYKKAIEKIQSYGIGVLGAFILGLDTDTPSVFKKTADFINSSKLYAAQLTILTPLPGTRLRERLKKENRLLPSDWGNFNFLKANFVPKNMSPQQLERGLKQTYRDFYNPKRNAERVKYFKEIYLRSLKKSR